SVDQAPLRPDRTAWIDLLLVDFRDNSNGLQIQYARLGRLRPVKGAAMPAPCRRSAARSLTLAAALGVTLGTGTLLAQTPTGTILGTVKDAQGAVVPGATVTATNEGTKYSRSAVSDDAGEYALRLLPIG